MDILKAYLINVFAFLCVSNLALAASITDSVSFVPADGARTYMDRGGVWDGTTEVTSTTGDTFRAVFNNAASGIAYDFAAELTIPVNFAYVAASASASLSGAGCGAVPTVTASRTVNTLNITFTPASYDLPENCELTIDFGLSATGSETIGTKSISSGYRYASSEGDGLNALTSKSVNVDVYEGKSTITMTPLTQSKGVAETAEFFPEVCNTGFGGLFDVQINESSINPNAANSLQIALMTQQLPATPVATGALPAKTIAYLAPGACYREKVDATVTGCNIIENTATTNDRLGETSSSILASVALDLNSPLANVTTSTLNIPGTGVLNVSLPISNTTSGNLRDLKILFELDLTNIDLTNVHADWSWDSGTKTFTYNGNGGDLGPNGTLEGSVSLTFDLARKAICPAFDGFGGFYTVITEYKDDCGNDYIVPTKIDTFNVADATDALVFEKTPTASFFPVLSPGDPGTYTLSVDPTDPDIDSAVLSSDVVITDELPADLVNYSIAAAPAGTSYTCSGACQGGDTLTWTLTEAAVKAAGAPITLDIDYEVSTGATDCNARNTSNTGHISYIASSCAVNNSDSSSIIILNPGTAQVQSVGLDVVNAPASGTSYEAGAGDLNTDGIRDSIDGEGEFIEWEAHFESNDALMLFNGSTYTDNYGGLAGQTLVPNSVMVTLSGTGSANPGTYAVPGGSIISTSPLQISLDFLSGAGFHGSNNIQDTRTQFNYKTTIPDSHVAGAEEVNVLQQGTWDITGYADCTGGTTVDSIKQIYVSKRYSRTSISLSPVLEICGTYPITIGQTADSYGQPWHPRYTVKNGAVYDIPAQTPTYTGGFSGETTFTYLGDDSTFEVAPEKKLLASNGTISLDLTVPANATTVPSQVCIETEFDTTQGLSVGPKNVSLADACSTPVKVLEADLNIFINPQSLQILPNQQISFDIVVTNAGSGNAYNVAIEDTLPAGIVPNLADTNTANPLYAATLLGQKLDWMIAQITPGQSIILTVKADEGASSCANLIAQNSIRVAWGCGGTDRQVKTSNLPNFAFVSGDMTSVHETSTESLTMCSLTGDYVVVRVKNAGLASVDGVVLRETLNPSTSGVEYLAGSTEYASSPAGPWTAGGDPTGTGEALDPYIWDSTDIPSFVAMDPDGGANDEVYVRFKTVGNELIVSSSPAFTAQTSGTLFCGDPTSSPGSTQPAGIKIPRVVLTKTGRNITDGDVGFSSTVDGKPGDTIEWRVQVANSGDTSALFMDLQDDFPNTSGSPSGTLTGPGHAGTAIAENTDVNINDVSNGSTNTYFIQETLGATCLNTNNVARVEWGCSLGSPNRLTGPTRSSHTAALVMNPSFGAGSNITQTFTDLPGGRARIDILVTNTTAYTHTMELTNTVPTNYEYDSSTLPTVTGDVSSVTTTGSLAVPVFSFPGETTVEGDSFTLTFYIKQSAQFDATDNRFTNPELAGADDPTVPADADNVVSFRYSSACAGPFADVDTVSFSPKTPDLDISVQTPTSEVVGDAQATTANWTIVNNGEAGSLADNGEFFVTVGNGWGAQTVSVITPAPANAPYGAGSGGACAVDSSTADVTVYKCTTAQLGALAPGDSALVRMTGTSSLASGRPLTVKGEIYGNIFTNNGTDSGDNYSYDSGQIKYVGIVASKTLLSTTEAFTTGSNVAIGEDITYRLRYQVFGLDGADTASQVENITVRDTLPTGLGYVTHANAPGHDLTYSFTAPAVGAENIALNFDVNDILNPTTGGLFLVDLTTRVLNNATTLASGNLVNNFGVQYDIFGSTFGSNNGTDGFGGSEASLHSDHTLTIFTPTLAFSKQVRNVTDAGAFADSISAVAGNLVEYRITLQNTGEAPLFDVSVTDLLPSDIQLLDSTSDTIDNDGDGSADGGDSEGTFNTGTGAVLFNQANTAIPVGSPEATFNILEPTGTITLLVRGTIKISVTPDDSLENNAAYSGSTLPGATGSQTGGTTGASGTPTGESVYTGSDTATANIDDVSLMKSIVTTSVNADTSTDVVVGETVTFRLTTILPEGTIPSFKYNDAIPAGFKLVSTSAPVIGSAISGCTVAGTTITPATPAAGPTTLEYAFGPGDCVGATASSDVNRTITADYTVVVENTADNDNADTIANSATYTFTGFTSAASTVTTTIKEPVLTIQKVFKSQTVAEPAKGLQAGDTVTYTITINNTGTAPAYDLVINDLGDEDLVNPTVTANPDNPGAPSNEGTASGVTTWKWDVAGPVATSGSYAFDVTYTLDTDVKPTQDLSNTANVAWTSTPGANAEERNGTGGVNDYTAANATAVNITVGGVTFDKTIKAPVVTTYAVGDDIVYVFESDFPDSRTDEVRFRDTLPTGLKFISSSLTATDLQKVGGGAVTLVSGPSANDTGAITFDFGDLENSGANPNLKLEVTVRVQNIATNIDAQNLINAGALLFDDPDNSGTDITVAEATPPTVTVIEPNIAVNKTIKSQNLADAGKGLQAGDSITYTITIDNTGTAPAYDLVIDDLASEDLINPVVAANPDNPGAPSNEGTSSNVTTWRWNVAGPIAKTNGQYKFDVTFTVDSDVSPTQNLNNTVEVTWTSTSGANGDERNGSDGVGGLNDYEAVDATPTSVSVGGVTFDKSIKAPGTTEYAIGSDIIYVLDADLPASRLDDVKFRDTLPTGLKFISASLSTTDLEKVGAGAVTVISQPAVNATGALEFTFGNIQNTGANPNLKLEVTARVQNIASNIDTQTRTNTGSILFDDPNNGGADVTVAEATPPTITVIEPNIAIDKTFKSQSLADATKGLQAGDTVTYTITVSNSGTAPAYDLVIDDLADQDLINPVVAANPDNPGAPANQGTALGVTTYRWNVAGPIAKTNGEYKFDVTFTLDSDVSPTQDISNTVQITWTSSPGANADERNGSGGINDYSATDATPVNVTVGNVTFDKTIKAPGVTNYAVGEDIVYLLDADLPASRVDKVRFKDTLPTGLKFISSNIIATDLQKFGGGAVTLVGSPAANATGAIEFDFGDLQNTGASPNLKLEVTVRVQNVATNIDTQTRINTGSISFDDPDNPGSDLTVSEVAPPTITVVEPNISVDKIFKSQSVADIAKGLQAGDTVTYTITVSNTGTAPAYDLVIDDLGDEDLVNPIVAANPDNPGAPANQGTALGVTTWRWNVAGPVAKTNGEYKFDVTFTLDSDVSPTQDLENTVNVTWTSTSGANSDERNGSGGINDYSATDATPVSVTVGNATFDKTIKAPGVTNYNVGDDVVYVLQGDLPASRVNELRYRDTLPAGMKFISANLIATNLQKVGGGAVTIVSGPAANATGALEFDFGDIVNTAANPSLVLEVTARVQDVITNVNNHTLTNNGAMLFDDPDNSGSDLTIAEATPPTITVREPILVNAVDGPVNASPGFAANYSIRVQNSGTGTAYQPVVSIELPSGMRDTDPTGLTLSAAISGGRVLPLVAGVDYTINYNAGTGKFDLTFISAAAYIATTETLTIQFQAQPDDDTLAGVNLDIVSTITSFHSTDISSGAVDEDKNYTTAFGVGTTGTANGVSGDDVTDNHQIVTQAPSLVITKAVNLVTAAPGATLNYIVTLTNNGNSDAVITTITDDLNAAFQPGTMTAPVASVGVASQTANSAGGVNSTGTWSVNGFTVPSGGGAVNITFSADLANVIPSGTLVINQAGATVVGQSGTLLSDSSNPADNDAIETGNNPGNATDDDPTKTVVLSGPNIVHQKISDHSGDGQVVPGDVITYTILVTNLGNENTYASTLQDAIPGNTTYVPNSTTLNGVPVADVGGNTPLAYTMPIQSAGDPAGRLIVGNTATIQLKVTVNSNLANGTVINNQAVLNTTGDGSGTYDPIPSDDPESGVSPDPTTDIVGNYPSLSAVKFVGDINGSPLLAGEDIRYTVVIRNEGSTDANNVVFTDVLPTTATYVANSITFDADGISGAVFTPIPATDAVDGDGLQSDGTTLTLNLSTLAKGQEVSLSFDMTTNAVADGTVILNQGFVKAPGLPEIPTDSNSDPDDGLQPTRIVVGNNPFIRLSKTVTDLNGGRLRVGDDILYSIIAENIGAVDATNVLVTDASLPPANTTYAPSSTQVSGSTSIPNGVLTDIVGVTPLATGVNVGTIEPGSRVVLTAVVNVNTGTSDGVILSNQASFVADGGLSGISDSGIDDTEETGNDPLNPQDDDPTLIQVGGSDDMARVGGYVWLDDNHDRVFDPSETPEGGWIVEILQDGILVDSTTTSSSGYYEFDGIQPGTGYQIQFRHPITNAVFGGSTSGSGADTSDGTIQGLTLTAGFTKLDESLPIDPSGVVYDSIARTPVEGVFVQIVDPSGARIDPSCFLPGQQDQTTGADGRYRFDVVMPCVTYPVAAEQTFCMLVTAPSLFLPINNSVIPVQTSSVIPTETTVFDPTGMANPVLIAPNNGNPTGSDPTTYYTCFDLEPGDPNVVNNHIAVDPVLEDAFVVTKTSPYTTATKGQNIPYTITVKNTLPGAVVNLDLKDEMPPGFIYQEDSAAIDGIPVDAVQDGRTLTWNVDRFEANEEKTLTVILTAGIGIGEGEYINQAYVVQVDSGRRASNIASAKLYIVPDPIFDCPELIGKVYDDANENGFQDTGEIGIPGVDVVSARGHIVKTDEHGRYHAACPVIPDSMHGSNYVLKVNPRTLPTGYRLTTENPGVVRLTRGKMSKLNFGASIHKVMRVQAQSSAFNTENNLDPKYLEELKSAYKALTRDPAVIRIAYHSQDKDKRTAYARRDVLRKAVMEVAQNSADIEFEEEIHWNKPFDTQEKAIVINEEYPINLQDQFSNHELLQKHQNDKSLMNFQCKVPGVEAKPEIVQSEENPFKKYIMNFKVLHSTLEQAEVDKFMKFVGEVKKSGEIERFKVVGHTDNDPILGRAREKFADNGVLSRFRADLAANAFRKVFPEIPMTTEGKADTMPLVENSSPANKAKNRRTEVWVYLKPTRNSVAVKGCKGLACYQDTQAFRVTFDGEPWNLKKDSATDASKWSSQIGHIDFQRCNDVALEDAKVQVRYNPTVSKKILSAYTEEVVVTPKVPMTILPYSNYSYFIKDYELRIYRSRQSVEDKPYLVVKPEMTKYGQMQFKVGHAQLDPENQEYFYVLRAYSKKHAQRYDETTPVTFARSDIENAYSAEDRPELVGYGHNQLLVSQIVVRGGAVTVNGDEIPAEKRVMVMGQEVPKDKDGQFVTQQILPYEMNHAIDVSITDQEGKGIEMRRDISIPANDWFFVGIADVTVGQNETTGPVELVTNDDSHFDDEVYVDGRVAFYLKGKIKGKYIVTASLDTTEDDIDNMFSSIDKHRTQDIFRRLNEEEYYPVYGDDSTLTEDAPTKGKFYVKIARDKNYLMWGNFKTDISDTENAKFNRSLYGGQLHFRSKEVMASKEHKTQFTAFAAEPGTIAGYEEYRGALSSFYSLRNSFIVVGSEKVRVEIRDINSDLVLKSRTLQIGEDYELNYARGAITLSAPLPAIADQSPLVQAGSLSGNKVYLVVTYEHSPIFTSGDNLVVGGRVHHWFGDYVKLGATNWKQDQTGGSQEVLGLDTTLRYSKNTYLKAEWSQSSGKSIDQYQSISSGFDYQNITAGNTAGIDSTAKYLEFSLGLYDGKYGDNKLTGYYDEKEAGYSVPGRITPFEKRKFGGELTLSFAKDLKLFAKHDSSEEQLQLSREVTELNAAYGKKYKYELGVKLDNKEDLSSGVLTQLDGFGQRVDAIVKVGRYVDKNSFYLFHQQTIDSDDTREENTRTGVGADYAFTKNLKLGAEISTGDGGFGGKLSSTYKRDKQTSLYTSLLKENNNASSTIDGGQQAYTKLTNGFKQKFKDSMSIYYENQFTARGETEEGLTHNFGVDYDLTSKWKLGFSGEFGMLESNNGQNSTERRGGTLKAGYQSKSTKFSQDVEYREDKQSSGEKRKTLLTKTRFKRVINKEWTLFTKVDLLESDSSLGKTLDGSYKHAQVGVAYRPLANDKWNLLGKVGYYEQLPSAAKVDAQGAIPDFKQRSTLANIDNIIDINKYLSLGLKYGFAKRDLQNTRLGNTKWFSSDVQLGVIRLDITLPHQWSVIAEYRKLWMDNPAQQDREGALLGIFKQISDNNLRVGVGYNFSDFSDDLTKTDYEAQGWFINIISSF